MAAKKKPTRRTSSSVDRTRAYAEAVVSGEIIAGPHVRNACRRHLDDLETGHKRGLRFDHAAADLVFGFFENVLKLSEGQFEGLAFQLQPAQAFIVGSLFGWKRANGTRRFRRAYIEQGKGNGKSPMAGGIGLFGLCAAGEAGSQVYAAAAKKDQAQILFQDACKMVRAAPALAKRLDFSGGMGREFNIAHLPSGSFFRPVSRDTGKTGSGPRPFFVLADEVHELPDRKILEMLERGFKFRREPLLFMITNSGSDRNSVAWEEHEHAVKVAAGNPDAVLDPTYLGQPLDDATFSYVCALDGARTEVYSFDIALRHALDSCSCNAQITLTDLPSPQDFAALVIQRSEGQTTSPKVLGVSITQTVLLLLDAFASIAIRRDESSAALKQLSGASSGKRNGQSRQKASPGTESATGDTGSAKRNPTQRGKPIGVGFGNTGSLPSKPKHLERRKVAAAEYAVAKLSVSGWITATLQEMFEDSSAIPAIQELVCSEIIKRLYEGHSPTCKVRQRFRLQSGSLAEDLPADDPLNDPSCWIKANPLLGVTITEEYLSEVVAQAKAIPGQLNGILRLHFCVWTDAETAWMTRATLEPCLADFEIAEHHGEPVYLGLDLSQNRDITALGAVVRTGTDHNGKPTFDAWAEAWTPGDTIAARELRDKLPYTVWAREGHIHTPQGENISYRHVAQTLAEYAEQFDVQAVAYDRFAFKRFEEEVDELGLVVPFAEHPQGGLKKGKPTTEGGEGLWMPGSLRLLEDALLEGRIRIKRNPVLISAMMSAVPESDKWDNRWLAKSRSVNKIDAAVALCMAMGAAMQTHKEAEPMFMVL